MSASPAIKSASKILLLSIFLIVTSQACNAAPLKKVKYKTADGTIINAYMMRPARRGRFPAIVALHGCSGLKKNKFELLSRHLDWANRFVKWGYVVFFPDSYGSRNTGSLCKRRARSITYQDRVEDARSARTWLSRQPFINRKNISVFGWSDGGGTALRLAYSQKGKGFRRAIAFYPECRSMLRKKKLKLSRPLTILMGKRDNWTPPEACQKLVWNAGGNIILYNNAHHGFDIPNAPLSTVLWVAYSKRPAGIVMVGTNKKARRQSIEDVRKTLRK